MDRLFEKAGKTASDHGLKIIIVYHPETEIDDNGNLRTDTEPGLIDVFKQSCDENGIVFADMTETFKAAYLRDHTLPYGFSNSPVGKGHLNKNGHAMVAEELYKLICEMK